MERDSDFSVEGVRLPRNLPRGIENAMEATTEMGFRYLWIDRYCIRQDDDSAAKHAQIQNMNLVYGSSALTIIAAAGLDPSYGLPGIGSTARDEQQSVRIGNRTVVVINNDVKEQIRASKWDSRAWTYQEAYLSKRRLVSPTRWSTSNVVRCTVSKRHLSGSRNFTPKTYTACTITLICRGYSPCGV